MTERGMLTEMTQLALPLLGMHVAQVNESAHLNSVGNLRPHRPTDQRPRIGPHIAGKRAGVLHGEVDSSTAPVKGNFDEFHNQWLTRLSYK